jgi:hypothetical protein
MMLEEPLECDGFGKASRMRASATDATAATQLRKIIGGEWTSFQSRSPEC